MPNLISSMYANLFAHFQSADQEDYHALGNESTSEIPGLITSSPNSFQGPSLQTRMIEFLNSFNPIPKSKLELATVLFAIGALIGAALLIATLIYAPQLPAAFYAVAYFASCAITGCSLGAAIRFRFPNLVEQIEILIAKAFSHVTFVTDMVFRTKNS